MVIKLNKEDNKLIVDNLYKLNETLDIPNKLVMDSYINSLDIVNNDVIFNCYSIDAIEIEGVPPENYGYVYAPGINFEVKLSSFDDIYRNNLISSIREIKLKRLID